MAQWIGLAEARTIERLAITWPDGGRTQVLRGLAANRRLVVVEDVVEESR